MRGESLVGWYERRAWHTHEKSAHPGRLIKDEIDALGLSVAQAAEGLGVTRQQLYRVVKGECAISPEMAMFCDP